MTATIPIEYARWRRSQIAERFASNCLSAPCYRFTEYVGFLAIVKAELKLRKVQRQILLANAVIAAHDSTLEQRPERFDGISMHDAAHVLVLSMPDEKSEALSSSQLRQSALSRWDNEGGAGPYGSQKRGLELNEITPLEPTVSVL